MRTLYNYVDIMLESAYRSLQSYSSSQADIIPTRYCNFTLIEL